MNESLYHRKLLALAKSRKDDAPLSEGGAIVRAFRDNPLCGDSVRLSARVENAPPQIRLSQQTRGCVLCEAAAALMLQLCENADDAKLRALCANAENMFANPDAETAPEFAVFAPVAAHPARHECVLLPFRALSDILAELPTAVRKK